MSCTVQLTTKCKHLTDQKTAMMKITTAIIVIMIVNVVVVVIIIQH